jgi:choloylglycine hydrolase
MIPTSFETAGTADIWPTYWRMYTDLRDMVVFYESATSPMLFWYNVKDFNLSKKGKAMVLSLKRVSWQDRMGDMTKEFDEVTTDQCQHIWTDC